MSYIVIPIFSDPYLHPLHKNNGLSMLYVKKIGEDSQMICNYHPDCAQSSEDYRWLESETFYIIIFIYSQQCCFVCDLFYNSYTLELNKMCTLFWSYRKHW